MQNLVSKIHAPQITNFVCVWEICRDILNFWKAYNNLPIADIDMKDGFL